MTAKEYLQQIEKLDTLIRNKLTEAIKWREVAGSTGMQSEGERVQSTGSKQKMESAIVEYINIEDEIKAEIHRLFALEKEIIQRIEALSTTEYDVLHKIYVQGKDFQDVAEDHGKSYSWVISTHGRALANLQRILNERENDEKSKKS